MKIISKHKDYYDYLQGIYGVDEKLVLDRRNFYKLKLPYYNTRITIHIGEWCIQGYYDSKANKIHYGKDIEPFSKDFPKYNQSGYTEKEHYYIRDDSYRNGYFYCLKAPKFLGEKSPTWKYNTPILANHSNIFTNNEYLEFVILKELNIASFVDAKTCWLWLNEWLSKRVTKNEPDVPIGDDKIRIKSAGFDLKKSFRKRKDS